MKKSLSLLFLFILSIFSTSLRADSNLFLEEESYLSGRIQKGDKRYPTFLLALQLLKQLNATILVETGTARNGDLNFWGDGGSTIIFGDWASKNNAMLYSVDITHWAINNAILATIPYQDNIKFTLGDSITFLENFSQPIDFLYLDSFDFDVNNPLPSQEHHLKELLAVYPKLHEKTVVMIDDCDLPHGGKGKLAIEYLLSRGWTVLYNGYQTILIPENF